MIVDDFSSRKAVLDAWIQTGEFTAHFNVSISELVQHRGRRKPRSMVALEFGASVQTVDFETEPVSRCHCTVEMTCRKPASDRVSRNLRYGRSQLFALVASAFAVLGCGSSEPSSTLAGSSGSPTLGGAPGSGGGVLQGGTSSTGGSVPNGGTVATSGKGGSTATGNGGAPPAAGGTSPSTGGNASTGGVTGVGGNNPSTGGSKSTGGAATTGGAKAIGGMTATGGSLSTGGVSAAGGNAATGGTNSTGGLAATGGAKATGGSSATGGAISVGGSSGSSGYSPCPTNGDPCKILPFGDSITNGVASTDLGGYRSQLFKLVIAASQKVTFTGSQSSGPAQVSGTTFPKNHEGRSGWTIDPGYSSYGAGGISTLVPTPAFSTVPNIVLLMIGTNDVTYTSGQSTMTNRLEGLLDKIISAAPNALIVLAKLTPLSWNPAALSDYNAKLPGIVSARAAKGQHIVGVDMSQMPLTGLATDNVHPNDQGYSYMAGVWYAAIKDLLPK